MGRTLLPFRMALEQELATWKSFRKRLEKKDQEIFDQLIQYSRHHADAGSLAARSMLSEVIFMSIAIEQQKTINDLHSALKILRNQLSLIKSHGSSIGGVNSHAEHTVS